MNPFARFLGLLPTEKQLRGIVDGLAFSGKYLVTLEGGGQIQAKSEATYSPGAAVYIKGGVIQGPAPTLPPVSYEI